MEQRTREYQVCRLVSEPQTREVNFTVCVPQTQTKTVTVTRYRSEPETQTRTINVCVPYTYTEEVPVTVCRRVARTIEVNGCNGCDSPSCCCGG
jgi:hypothetical protein